MRTFVFKGHPAKGPDPEVRALSILDPATKEQVILEAGKQFKTDSPRLIEQLLDRKDVEEKEEDGKAKPSPKADAGK